MATRTKKLQNKVVFEGVVGAPKTGRKNQGKSDGGVYWVDFWVQNQTTVTPKDKDPFDAKCSIAVKAYEDAAKEAQELGIKPGDMIRAEGVLAFKKRLYLNATKIKKL